MLLLDCWVSGKSGDGVSDATLIGKKSAWDDLFGGSSSSDSTALQRASAASAVTSEADRADSWLDSTPAAALTSNHHHGDHTGSSLFDSSTMFDDAFLDGLVGVKADQTDDAWNSSTAGHDTWSADRSYCRSPFDDVAVFPEPTATSTSLRTTTGGDERARPRPRPQTAATPGTNIDNPFSVTLQAATAAARSAVEELVITALSF